MSDITGLVRSVPGLGKSAVYSVEPFPDQAAALCIGQPVTITSSAPPKTKPLTCTDLSPAHMGAVIVVQVLGGAVIEDQILTMYTDYNDKRPRIWLSFKNVMSSLGTDHDPLAVFPAGSFAVMPDTKLIIVREAK